MQVRCCVCAAACLRCRSAQLPLILLCVFNKDWSYSAPVTGISFCYDLPSVLE
jgi:hypothetical protein